MSRYYIIGDIHGQFERIEQFCLDNQTTKDDVLIILGDAGINYYGPNDRRDLRNKQYLQALPITLFSIHGNHEERPNNIPSYHERIWNNGIVYVEDTFPNLLFAKDGEIYDINQKKVLVIGGAYSVDKNIRLLRGYKWWSDEQPSEETKRLVEDKLDANNWTIDIVLTHTCPLKYEPIEVFLPFVDQSKVDKGTEEWLDWIEDNLSYQKWYCGHFHTEKVIDNLEFMFMGWKEF